MQVLACFAAIGALLGIALPLPAFAMLLVMISIAYAVLLTGGDLTLLGRVYALVSAAIALQVGYFLAVLARVQIYRILGAKRTISSSDESDRHK